MLGKYDTIANMPDSLLIATFALWKDGKRTPINGMIEPLLSFFGSRVPSITLIDGPHPGSDRVKSIIEIYDHNVLRRKKCPITSRLLQPLLHRANRNQTQFIFKIRDILAVFECVLRNRRTFDLFIGLESIYAIAGIILKKFGMVKKVVYYVSDYSPNRYKNTFINNLYLRLDQFCCYNADFIWDVSPAMHPARTKAGLLANKSKPVILVPNALFPNQTTTTPLSKKIPYSLVYAGTLGTINGPQIAVAAMKNVVSKYPQAILHIFGGGDTYEQQLKELAKQLDVKKNIVFHGFETNLVKLSHEITRYMLGIAPYLFVRDSPRLYADATKLRLYLGASVPIITTTVPPLGKEIEAFGAGLVTDDSVSSLTTVIIKVFDHKTLYRTLYHKAVLFARENTWENTYTHALLTMKL